ncbi:MAG: hypothetical protein QOI21_3475 [Actinomycetota bacterium]|jgi:hypothetical protein|nr:hypothetical protein [Actinomycetota bacterium]
MRQGKQSRESARLTAVVELAGLDGVAPLEGLLTCSFA